MKKLSEIKYNYIKVCTQSFREATLGTSSELETNKETHPGDKPSLISNGTNRECGKANTLKHQENRQDSNKISPETENTKKYNRNETGYDFKYLKH